MGLRTLTIDPLTDRRWHEFVAGNRQSTIFHHVEWLRLLHAQYRYGMHATCVVDAGGEIVAGVPFAHVKSPLTGNRFVAIPFSDLCPAVVAQDADADTTELLARSLHELHRDTRLDVQLRETLDGIPPIGKAFYHHEVPLQDSFDATLASCSADVRRQSRRSGRQNLEVRRSTELADLDAFFELHVRTRRRLGVPTQPRRFIRRLHTLFEAGLGFVILVTYESEPAAAGVFLRWGDTLTYKYSASAEAHLKRRPNHAMLTEALRWGCENGMTSLDLGRTDIEGQGLREFKLGWGGRERQLTYSALTKRATDGGSSGIPGFAKTIITRTPPATSRLAGLALYRHFG